MEGEHRLSLCRCEQLAIHQQRHFGLVGVDLDFGHGLGAVHIAAAAQMHEGFFFVPGSLVQIEGVFLERAVKGDDALLVLAVLAALITAVGGEIKQIPHMGGPQPGTFLNEFEHMLMVNALVAFGVVALFGGSALVFGIGVGAVLGESDAAVGILCVVFVKELLVLFQFSQIPAKVQVVAVHIGNFQNRAFGLQHEHVGHGGGPGGVQSVAQIVESAVVFQKFLIDGTGGCDLVGQPPHRNTGMVIVLDDEFFHLGERVGAAIGHVHGDVGDLRPDHQTVFITQVIEFLCVLIVGQTQGVGAQLFDDVHIPAMVLYRQGVALALHILMAGHAPQRITAAVEQESFLGIDVKPAAAEPGLDLIAAVQPGRSRVQVRIVQTIPQMDIVQLEHRGGIAFHHRHRLGLIRHRKGHVLCPAFHPGFHRHVGSMGIQIHDRRDLHARRTAVAQRKVGGRHHDEVYIPVQTAVEGEICFLGIDGVVVAVIHRNDQQVFFFQMRRQIHAEGGIPALVFCQRFAVEHDHRGVSRAVHLQPDFVGAVMLRHLQAAGVQAGAAVIVIAAVLPVHGVPGVGQVNGLALSARQNGGQIRFFVKLPAFVEVYDGAHKDSPFLCLFSAYVEFMLAICYNAIRREREQKWKFHRTSPCSGNWCAAAVTSLPGATMRRATFWKATARRKSFSPACSRYSAAGTT